MIEEKELTEKGLSSITSAQAKLLNEIQVPVALEIGEVCLSGSQLVDLLAGQVFDFVFDHTRPLAMKIGAETIAYARFVCDNDRLALEIIKLAGEQAHVTAS